MKHEASVALLLERSKKKSNNKRNKKEAGSTEPLCSLRPSTENSANGSRGKILYISITTRHPTLHFSLTQALSDFSLDSWNVPQPRMGLWWASPDLHLTASPATDSSPHLLLGRPGKGGKGAGKPRFLPHARYYNFTITKVSAIWEALYTDKETQSCKES